MDQWNSRNTRKHHNRRSQQKNKRSQTISPLDAESERQMRKERKIKKDTNIRQDIIHSHATKELINNNNTDKCEVTSSSEKQPSAEIVTSICFQKFRYENEARPGKKYQEKDFIMLKLNNLKDNVVRVVIVCTDAENHQLIHPNGLVGVNCHDGIYDFEYGITTDFLNIKIPYLRIWRMKTKKNGYKKIHKTLSNRASYLPSPYKERCLSQCSEMNGILCHDFDTNKVCLGVIVTVENNIGNVNGTLHAISPAIINASQKTKLEILKLSKIHVPAMTGGYINIFTTENSPLIEPEKYKVYVTYDSETHGVHWKSKKFSPRDNDLLYKKVISYQVPRFEPIPHLTCPIEAFLNLTCPRSNLHCKFEFYYVPQTGNSLRKKTYREEKSNNFEQDVKLPSKKLKINASNNDENPDDSKEMLWPKAESLHNNEHAPKVEYVESQNDLEVNRGISLLPEHEQYYYQQQYVFNDQDPLSGETSYLLDRNVNSCSSSSNKEVITLNNEKQLIFSDPENSLLGTSPESNIHANVNVSSQSLNDFAPKFSIPVNNNIILFYSTDGTVTRLVKDCSM